MDLMCSSEKEMMRVMTLEGEKARLEHEMNLLRTASNSALSGAKQAAEKAKKTVWRLQTLSVGVCVLLGAVLVLLSGIIPDVYNTGSAVKECASEFLIVIAIMLPFDAFVHGCYFTLRSGGKIVMTFLFDCGSVWLIGVPVAVILANFTTIPVALVFLAVRSIDVVKTIIGTILIRKGIWISNIVN